MEACKEEVTAAIVAREGKRVERNHSSVVKLLAEFHEALDALAQFSNARGLFGEKGFPPSWRARLGELVAPEPRHESAVCCITGIVLQTWSEGEGTERYWCADASVLYRSKEAHEALVAVCDKVALSTCAFTPNFQLLFCCLCAQIASLNMYKGLAEECLSELRCGIPASLIRSRFSFMRQLCINIRPSRFTPVRCAVRFGFKNCQGTVFLLLVQISLLVHPGTIMVVISSQCCPQLCRLAYQCGVHHCCCCCSSAASSSLIWTRIGCERPAWAH